MCVFLISPVPIAELLTSELIDTPVFHNLAPRPIKYRVSVPIPNSNYSDNPGRLKQNFILKSPHPYLGTWPIVSEAQMANNANKDISMMLTDQ